MIVTSGQTIVCIPKFRININKRSQKVSAPKNETTNYTIGFRFVFEISTPDSKCPTCLHHNKNVDAFTYCNIGVPSKPNNCRNTIYDIPLRFPTKQARFKSV